MEKKDNDNCASRWGGYKRRKGSDVKIIVTPVYVGNRPMTETIGMAVIDSCRHEDENKETIA